MGLISKLWWKRPVSIKKRSLTFFSGHLKWGKSREWGKGFM
jgi:hypothetical protein